MVRRKVGLDYQALAVEFATGDVVVPYGAGRDFAGRVVTVWPAIGMVDVEFPAGSKRYPVEDLIRLDEDSNPEPPMDGYIPGGAGTVSVPGGPLDRVATQLEQVKKTLGQITPVQSKKALYWAQADRRYRATAEELGSGKYTCPKCKKAALKRAIYRRLKGKSDRLYGCPTCMFLIERDSILGGM